MTTETRWTRFLERVGILTVAEPAELGWHVSGSWPADDSGPGFDEACEALAALGDYAEAANASLARAGQPS
jgi:hypothetical protein